MSTRDDRTRYVTVETFHVPSSAWEESARRVTARTAAAIMAEHAACGHAARIVPNIYYAGVFGPSLEPRR